MICPKCGGDCADWRDSPSPEPQYRVTFPDVDLKAGQRITVTDRDGKTWEGTLVDPARPSPDEPKERSLTNEERGLVEAALLASSVPDEPKVLPAEALAKAGDVRKALEPDWRGLLDEARVILEVLVTNNPEKQHPYGDFAAKYRELLAKHPSASQDEGDVRKALLDAAHALDGIIDGDFAPDGETAKSTLERVRATLSTPSQDEALRKALALLPAGCGCPGECERLPDHADDSCRIHDARRALSTPSQDEGEALHLVLERIAAYEQHNGEIGGEARGRAGHTAGQSTEPIKGTGLPPSQDEKWQLVPKEPDENMIANICSKGAEWGLRLSAQAARSFYACALAVAPSHHVAGISNMMGRDVTESEALRRALCEQIDHFNDIIDRIERRCLAADGPVTPTLEEMREDELASLWNSLQFIRNTFRAREAQAAKDSAEFIQWWYAQPRQDEGEASPTDEKPSAPA